MRRIRTTGGRRRLILPEKLEQRVPLAADFAVNSAYLANNNFQQVSSLFEGESIFALVNYTQSGMDGTSQYKITMELDGVPIVTDPITTVSGSNITSRWNMRVGFASPGNHQVRITIDSAAQIAESNESNNSIVFNFTPIKTNSPKYNWPVLGQQGGAWTLLSYVDNDVRPNSSRDYRGSFITSDQHEGYDFNIADFRAMDQGWPVIAAAPGTVIATGDGNFDRWVDLLDLSRQSNFVVLDHGNGWHSLYYLMLRNSVTVKVGESVVTGQTLGLIGSSGISDAPHLHFQVEHNGAAVDIMHAPADYWVTPPTYLLDSAPRVMSSWLTDRDPTSEWWEGANDIRTFQLNGSMIPWSVFSMDYSLKNDQFVTDWIRPDGTTYFHDVYSMPNDQRVMFKYQGSDAIHSPGLWTAVTKRNGVEVARQTYTVVGTGNGAPELDVRQNGTYIVDNRLTPINFGSAVQNGVAPELVFSIGNIGTAPLSILNVSVPDGFQVVSAPSTVNINQTGQLRLRMLTNKIDHHWGDVVITTNDSDEDQFTFGVEGFVTGTVNSNAPVLTNRTEALPIESGLAAVSVFDQLQVADANTLNFSGGKLTAEIITGRLKNGEDRLLLRFQSADWLVVQDIIQYQGRNVGQIISDGSSGKLEIRFIDSIDKTMIEQLGRSIAFWQQNTSPSFRRRVVELKLVDPNGLENVALQRPVFYSRTTYNQPPNISTITNASVLEDAAFGPIDLQISDLNDPIQSLVVNATSSNPGLVPDTALSVAYASGKWQLQATPIANQFGQTLITLVATDPNGVSATIAFVLNVQSQNDLPTISSIANQTTTQGNTLPPIPFQISDIETDASALTLSATSTNLSLITSGGISFGGSADSRTVSLTPIDGKTGQSTIRITVTDANGGQRTSQFLFTVNPENTPPTITSINDLQTQEDQATSATFTIDDNITAANLLVLTAASNNTALIPISNITFSGTGADRTVNLNPIANASGVAQVVVTVKDQAGNTAKSTFTLTVTPVNDAPSFNTPTSVTALEDAINQSFSLSAITAGGAEQQPLQFQFVTPNPELFEVLAIDYTSPQSTALVRWKPAPNASGTTNLVITLTDAGLDGDLSTSSDNLSLVKTVVVNVTAVNDLPSFEIPSQASVDEDSPVQLTDISAISPGPLETTQILTLSATTNAPELFSTLSIVVPIRVIDSGTPPISADFQLSLDVTAVVSPWRNPTNSLDVSHNDLVSPSDALLIINYLNSGASRILDPNNLAPIANGPFLDVTGDRIVAPSDALQVINYLNRLSGGEGEGTSKSMLAWYGRLVSSWPDQDSSDPNQLDSTEPISTGLNLSGVIQIPNHDSHDLALLESLAEADSNFARAVDELELLDAQLANEELTVILQLQ
ncbi:MAG: peptidoglycan DD-metalloendopeptidase family protein [Pirellulales bacterium]